MKLTFDIKDLQHGDHVCLLYQSSAEQKNMVGSFIKDGLQRGELCLYLADEGIDSGLARLLAAEGVDMLRLQQEGSLQVLNRYQSFLRYARFEPILMREFYERIFRETVMDRYSGLRVFADMTWALSIGCEQLITFEALLNDFLPQWKMTHLCLYNIERFAPNILQDVLATHSIAVINGHVCPNFYYAPDFVIGKHDPKVKLQWMLNTLKKASVMGKAYKP